MKIYWSPSVEIGIAAAIIFWITYFRWDKLKMESFNKKFFKTSSTGIIYYFIYTIFNFVFIVNTRGWGADSPLMQLMQSFILFSIVFVPTVYVRKHVTKKYWLIGILFTVLSALWAANSILFNSGLSPYDKLGI